MPRRSPYRRRRRGPGAFLWRFILAALLASVAVVLSLRWLTPMTSAVMIERRLEWFMQGGEHPPLRYQWVSWQEISPEMALAVIAAEDQKFFQHHGFDLDAIVETVERASKGERLRGASTISQQVAKNLFLWQGRSYLRKALEAYGTMLLELLWPKERILEVYLNIAEFGDGVYGVGAATKAFMARSPARLTRNEAALLAAVLPSPRRFSVRQPSPYVLERRQWIKRQMGQLGGIAILGK